MTEFTRKMIDEQHDEGRTGMRSWVLSGLEGAVQVSFMKLPEIPSYFRDEEVFPGGWTGVDFGYHSPRPLHDGNTSRPGCDFVAGGVCFYAGSSIPAQPLLQEWWKADCDDEVIWLAAELGYRAKFLDELPGEPSFEEKVRVVMMSLGIDLAAARDGDEGQEDRPA